MRVAKIIVSGNMATVQDLHMITSGTVGATVAFDFDETWDGFSKVYVFRTDSKTLDDTKATGVIPAELLTPGARLSVGVYGTKGDIAQPTVWADLGVVRAGADPSGDESTDPSLPVWAQIQEEIAKLKEQSGGEIDPAEVQRIVEKYLQDNPPAAGYTPVKGKDYYTEADKQEMVNAVLAALPAAEGVSY